MKESCIFDLFTFFGNNDSFDVSFEPENVLTRLTSFSQMKIPLFCFVLFFQVEAEYFK